MYIQSFHMDGFGIFSDMTVEGLAPGLSIFLGENEAGKSTCLEFLRTTLAGYPAPNSREGKLIPGPLRGGNAGGSLTLNAHKEGILRLTRRPGGSGGHVSLTDAQGKPLDEDVLRRLPSGVSRDVYRNVFGFSLTELENMANLTGESVRHALYGASFGPGLRSPGEVLAILKKQTDDIFKSGGDVYSKRSPGASFNRHDVRRLRWRGKVSGNIFPECDAGSGYGINDLANSRGYNSVDVAQHKLQVLRPVFVSGRKG